MIAKVYKGFISRRDIFKDGDGRVFLSSSHVPLTESVSKNTTGARVSIKYWLLDEACHPWNAPSRLARYATGLINIYIKKNFSDCGFEAWLSESFDIGGYDFLEELNQSLGKYLILEVTTHDLCPYCGEEVSGSFEPTHKDGCEKAHPLCYEKEMKRINQPSFNGFWVNSESQMPNHNFIRF